MLMVWCVVTSSAIAKTAKDDFDRYDIDKLTNGVPGDEHWSARWEDHTTEGDETQQGLWTITEDTGVKESQGYSLDVHTAKMNYHTIHTEGVKGRKIVIQADVKFETTDKPLFGINAPFVGLRINVFPDWWEGIGLYDDRKDENFCLVRRGHDVIGVFDPSKDGEPDFGIVGWIMNSKVGGIDSKGDIPDAWESEWITLILTLEDNGDFYQMTGAVEVDGEVLYESEDPYVTKVESGTEIYAGFTNGFHPLDGKMTTAELSSLSMVTVDNFSIKSSR